MVLDSALTWASSLWLPPYEPDLDSDTGALLEPEKERDIEATRPKKEYIAEIPIPKVTTIKIAPYWSDDEDDDDTDLTVREKTGVTEHLAAAATCTSVAGLSALYYKNPMITAGFASGTATVVNVLHNNSSETMQHTLRVAAITGLALSLILEYALSPNAKQKTIVQIISAIPWVYPFLGVVKADISQAELPKKLKDIAANYSVSLSDTTCQVICASLQAMPGLSVSLGSSNKTLSAVGGIFFKSNVRQLLDVAGQGIYHLETPWIRKSLGAAVGIAAVSSLVAGFAGNYFNWFSGTWGALISSVLIIPPADIASRTIKATIKAGQKERKNALKSAIANDEDTCWDKTKKIAQNAATITLITAPVVGAAYAVGQAEPGAQNPGIVASLLTDITSFIKIGTKSYPTAAVVGVSLAGAAAGTTVYVIKEIFESTVPIPMYPTIIALTATSSAFAMYHAKRYVRPAAADE